MTDKPIRRPITPARPQIRPAVVIPQPSTSVTIPAVTTTARPVLATTAVARPAPAVATIKTPTRVLSVEATRLLRPQVLATSRKNLTVPISPTPPISDEILFEEPADATKKRYLPRYQIAEESVSGKPQYRAVFERNGESWTLSFDLNKSAAASIASQARSATELEHTPSVLLVYSSNSAKKEFVFQEITPIIRGIRAVLSVSSVLERDELFWALTDRNAHSTLIVRRTFRIAVPVPALTTMLAAAPREPLYRQTTQVLDHITPPKPLIFDRELHRYIFREIGDASRRPGLIRHEIDGKSYYQDSVRRHIFYYLPDAFKIGRRPETPHTPLISLQFDSPDGLPEHTQVTFDYVAEPFVAVERLTTAATPLSAQLPTPLPLGVTGPEFVPLLVEDSAITFSLGLPRADATAGPFQKRQGAKVDLREGLIDSLTLSLKEFQPVWDAMAGAAVSALLQGEVAVALDDEGSQITEKIAFVGRLHDTAGPVFDYAEQPDPASDGLTVKLTNAIESTLRIERLSAWLSRSDSIVDANVNGLTTPTELRPGEQITVSVVPSAPMAAEGELDAQFDLSGVSILPDPEAVWSAIIEGNTPEYSKSITVTTFSKVFEAPADTPDDVLLELSVQFERGETVRLKPTDTETEKTSLVRFPLSDVIIGRSSVADYRYRITAVRLRSGVKQGAWKTSNADPLYIVSDEIPKAE